MTQPTRNRNESEILLDDFLDRYKEVFEVQTDLKAQQKEQADIVKDLLTEMKAQGFSTKALRVVMKRAVETAKERDERLETEAEIETYIKAVGLED